MSSHFSGIVMVAITPSQLAQVGPRPNALRLTVAGAAAVACGGALAVSWSRRSVVASKGRTTRGRVEGALRRLAASATAVDCVSGGMGEVAALLSLFPLDTLKVHCQARSVSLQQALAAVLRQGPVVAVRSLYAGVGTAAIGAAIVGAVHLSVFKYWKRLEERLHATSERASAAPSTGILAVWGAIVSSITVGALEAPLDQVKLRIQANVTVRGASPLKMLLETLSSVGARQMFNSSFVPFVLKAIPHDVGEFVTFGVLSEDRAVQHHLGPLSENAKDALLGAVAGCAAALLSNPFDVVCTKVQTSPPPSGGTHHVTMRSSLVAFRDTARAELAQGGIRRLYVGVVPRLMQMVPASVIYWLVVEEVRRSISSHAPKP